MEVAVLSQDVSMTLFLIVGGVLVFACYVLGIIRVLGHGGLSLAGPVSFETGIVILLVFLVVMLVAAPFYLLWELGCWVAHRFSPAGRAQHGRNTGPEQKERNVRLDQDRLERRLASSKQRAAENPEGEPVHLSRSARMKLRASRTR